VAKRTPIAIPKIESTPTQTPNPQPLAPTNQTALATAPKLKPTPIPASPESNPRDDQSPPTQPGNPSKVARAADQSPVANNQTSLPTTSKSPPGVGNFNPAENHPTPNNDDDFSNSSPGNNQPIATSKAPAPVASNGTGLASNPNKSKHSVNFDSLGGSSESPNSSDELGGGLPGKMANSLGGSSESPNSSDKLGGGLPGKMATGSNRSLSIQCLRNCEINYPNNLEDSEAGKDKILVNVTVDANGAITNAQIAKSSGNQNLDSATIDGVKQMQLTAMGKPVTFKIKVNTLLNN
jgi:TonB family protein